MGYYITVHHSKLKLSKSKQKKVMQALIDQQPKPDDTKYNAERGGWHNDGLIRPGDYRDLGAMLEDLGFGAKYNEKSTLVAVEVYDTKLYDHEEVAIVILSECTKSCYIEFKGEDGDNWLITKDGRVYMRYPGKWGRIVG